MPPGWLENVSHAVIAVDLVCALIIAADIVAGRHQKMPIMNLVWPITALYMGPIGLWAYWAMGRPSDSGRPGGTDETSAENGGPHEESHPPFWQAVFKATSHCGAGCTLGDAIAETGIFLLGVTLFGSRLATAYLVDFTLAYLFGIAFQYFTIAPMRGLGLRDGLVAAVKADTISLIAFEVGMFAFMALNRLVLFDYPPEPNTASYWVLMQVAMLVGFLTSFPANWWLVRSGLKESM